MDKNWTPPSHEDIQYGLATLPKRIYEQGVIATNLKETWLLLEAEYDLECAKSLITNKALNANLTGPELKALSVQTGYDLRIRCIKAEADYNRAVAGHTQLDDKFTAVKKEVEFLKVSQTVG